MYNDNVTKEIIDLFINEKNRKLAINEALYLSNYIQLVDDHNISSFRILYNNADRIMSIHLIDIPVDQTRKDYLESFREFMENCMQESYSKLVEDNQSQDEPFSVYLNRNVDLMKKKRKNICPLIRENNMQFKVIILLF
jgi:hypothetical protein